MNTFFQVLNFLKYPVFFYHFAVKLTIFKHSEACSMFLFRLFQLDEWPFETFCVELCSELFNPSWEIRHGASSALREVVKLHGNSAGKTKDTLVTKVGQLMAA